MKSQRGFMKSRRDFNFSLADNGFIAPADRLVSGRWKEVCS